MKKSDFILELEKPNFIKWVSYVMLDWLIIIVLMTVSFWIHYPVVYVLAIFFIGTRQHALSILGHDGAHLLASKNRKLNDWATCLFVFWPLGIGIGGYRKFHFTHHKTVGTIDDPELIHKASAAPKWDLPIRKKKHFIHLLKDIVGLSSLELLRLIKFIKPISLSDKIGPVIWWLVIISILVHFEIYFPIILWFTSIISSFWAVFRLRVWIEHTGSENTHRVSANWWQKLIFAPHNSWCHYEHHLYATIPLYNLDKVRTFDKSKSIMSITELFKSYRFYPIISSGQVGRDK